MKLQIREPQNYATIKTIVVNKLVEKQFDNIDTLFGTYIHKWGEIKYYVEVILGYEVIKNIEINDDTEIFFLITN